MTLRWAGPLGLDIMLHLLHEGPCPVLDYTGFDPLILL